jgi:hypothetical protein
VRALVEAVVQHEAVNVVRLLEHAFHVRGHRDAAVEAVAELVGRGLEILNEGVDVVFGARAVVARAVEHAVNGRAEPVG